MTDCSAPVAAQGLRSLRSHLYFIEGTRVCCGPLAGSQASAQSSQDASQRNTDWGQFSLCCQRDRKRELPVLAHLCAAACVCVCVHVCERTVRLCDDGTWPFSALFCSRGSSSTLALGSDLLSWQEELRGH